MADPGPHPNASVLACGGHGRMADLSPRSKEKAVTLTTQTTLACREYLEIILFGKVNYVTPQEFKDRAAHFVDMLVTEHHLLTDELSTLREVWEDFLRPRWLLSPIDAGTAAGWWCKERRVGPDARTFWDTTVCANAPLKAADFDALRDQLKTIDPHCDPPDEHNVHDAGVRLFLARESIASLRERMATYREQVVESTQTKLELLDLVEDTSVQILMLTSRFTTLNATQELAYRIGIMVGEGAARSIGAGIAGTSCIHEITEILRRRLPSILTDWLVRGLDDYMKMIGIGKARPIIRLCADQFVGFHCDLFLYLWDSRNRPPDDGALQELVQRRLYGTLAAVLALALGVAPEAHFIKKLVMEAVRAVAQTLASELTALRQAAKEQGVSFQQVIMQRKFVLIARVAQQLLIGMVGHIRFRKEDARATDARRADEAEKAEKAAAKATDGKATAASKAVRRTYHRIRDRVRHFTGDAHALTTKRLAPLGVHEFDEQFKNAGLNRVTAEAIRRYCNEKNMIFAFRASKLAALRHFGNPGKGQKPVFVKAKTESEGPDAGLVVRPGHGFSPKDAETMMEHGVLVLPALGSGGARVFHPEMVLGWGSMRPELKGVAVLRDFLVDASKKGFFELDRPNGKTGRTIDREIADLPEPTRATVAELWQKLKAHPDVGYYSDIDIVEAVDLSSGRRIAFGTGATPDEVAAMPRDAQAVAKQAQKNLERLNQNVAVLQGLAREKGVEEQAALFRFFQHGGHAERRDASGDFEFGAVGGVVVVTPDGRGHVLTPKTALTGADKNDSAKVRKHNDEQREAIERIVRKYLDDRYLSEDERHRRAQREASPPAPNRRPPQLRRRTGARLPRSTAARGKTPSDGGEDVSLRDLQASLVARGLVVVHADNASFFSSRCDDATLARLAADLAQLQVVAAVDPELRAIVITTAEMRGVGSALARLARAHRLIDDASLAMTRFFEVVAPQALVTHTGVVGILPGGSGNLDAQSVQDGDLLSANQPRERCVLGGFRALHLARSWSTGDDRVRGLVVEEVWRARGPRELEFTPTTIAHRRVLLFREPHVRVHEDPHEIPSVTCPAWVLDYDLASREGVWRALTTLGVVRGSDTLDGGRYDEAVRVFQASRLDLKVDGDVGPKTREALRAALSECEGDAIVGATPY